MRLCIAIFFALVATLFAADASWAATWESQGQRDNNGVDNAYASLVQGEYNLSFSCSEKSDHSLHMVLVGETFPNLYAADDVEAILTFRFNLPGGTTHKNQMKAWYYGGDQAWTGYFSVDTGILDSFAHAESMTLLNPKGETVLTFSMEGSAAAVKTIRKHCGLGLR